MSNIETEYSVHTCATEGCGVTYALTTGFDKRRRDDHGTFYCPNGHTHSYPQKTAEEILRDRLSAKDAVISDLQNKLAKKRKYTKKK